MRLRLVDGLVQARFHRHRLELAVVIRKELQRLVELNDAAFAQHKYARRVEDRVEAVRNRDSRALELGPHDGLDDVVRLEVDAACGLVKDEDLRPPHERAGAPEDAAGAVVAGGAASDDVAADGAPEAPSGVPAATDGSSPRAL